VTQTKARRLAAQITEATGTIAIATTDDRFHGRWETTHRWGIAFNGAFYDDVATLPVEIAPKEWTDEEVDRVILGEWPVEKTGRKL
jgi:hypothetical protein